MCDCGYCPDCLDRSGMIATVEEAQDQESKSPEEHLREEQELARTDFKAVISTMPGKAAVKAFLNTKATHYLTEAFRGQITRKQRRIAARQVANRLTKKVMLGEDIF